MSSVSCWFRAIAVAGLGAASFVSTHANAITTTVHDLILTRGGDITIFRDSFNDGLAPPNSPNFVASGAAHSYFIGAGSIPVDAEADGKLRLDSAWGTPTTSANGVSSQTVRMTVQSNADPMMPTSGIKAHHTFAMSALVDIEGASGEGSIQLRVNDRTSPGANPSTIREMVSIDFVAASNSLLFRRQDFVTNTAVTISSSEIPVDADAVRLMLLHPIGNDKEILAAAEYFDGNESLGVFSLAGSAQFFTYSSFARMELAASQVAAIPEPETYAMMLVGIGLVGMQLRRRARALRAQRLV